MPEESSPPLAASFQALLIETEIRMKHSLSNHVVRDSLLYSAGTTKLKKAQRLDDLGHAWQLVFLELLYRENMQMILEGFSQYCDSCVSIVQHGESRYRIEDALRAVEEGRLKCIEIGKRFMPPLSKRNRSNLRHLADFFTDLGKGFADIYIDKLNEVGRIRPMLEPKLKKLSELK